MEEWAANSKYGRDVQFLCVCIEAPPTNAPAVSKMFRQMFGFRMVVNGYIPSKCYFPVGYGQLGCSGFIVVDRDGNFISRKTKRYLDYGEEAFRDVERLLDEELARVRGDTNTTGSTTDHVGVKDASTETTNPDPSPGEKKKIEEVNESTNTTATIDAPPSVGVAVMDNEHEECTNAINALLQDPTTDNLRKALQVLQYHFLHEESLLKEYVFQDRDTTSSLSPFVSHRNDHERILAIAQDTLMAIESC